MKTKLFEQLFEEAMDKLEQQFNFGDDTFVNEETEEFDEEAAEEYAKEWIAEDAEILLQSMLDTKKHIKPEIINAAGSTLDVAIYLMADSEGVHPSLAHPKETKKLFMETYDIDEMLWPYWAQILYNYDLEGPLWVTYGDGKIRNKMLDAGYMDWDSVWDDFEIRY